MKNSAILFLSVVLFFSCKEQEARRPIVQKTATILSETLDQKKKLIALENKVIENYIAQDSTKQYHVASYGFWYSYITQKQLETQTPKIGDVVEISYNITNLYGNVFYAKDELGIKKYKIDKEDFIPALQEGIKLMKVGETITFVIPSYRAFGLVGDEHKIGVNQTIKSTVTLIKIIKK
ncbi:putative FKBP-type peptidyl-prolyl cis-trans isomerase FkpA [Polaribacter huanghezhanensis]|uniref:gliding motility-associated peptidyl-prolyl isomerase GldI n=1 Tax=Polaribacter huanghezhanensis TaxID=1354726 RepID=UPI0026474307|nr:gliding motility-associated peptidyl-prolyl isomerase GldI [Polaribacter huanghezhanensis]WKD86378.1 putative FKBP-type peptidyl-prolyl cis-trans isomerase FkpA [Polaribacter huanghezhanensis]